MSDNAVARLPTILDMSQQSLAARLPPECPFYDTWEKALRTSNPQLGSTSSFCVTPKQYMQHVGAHIEQLALFAIPRGYIEARNPNSDIDTENLLSRDGKFPNFDDWQSQRLSRATPPAPRTLEYGETGQSYQCDLCDYAPPGDEKLKPSSLRWHMCTEHAFVTNGKGLWVCQCEGCTNPFTKFDHLKTHMRDKGHDLGGLSKPYVPKMLKEEVSSLPKKHNSGGISTEGAEGISSEEKEQLSTWVWYCHNCRSPNGNGKFTDSCPEFNCGHLRCDECLWEKCPIKRNEHVAAKSTSGNSLELDYIILSWTQLRIQMTRLLIP
jgi:hypothetical protein